MEVIAIKNTAIASLIFLYSCTNLRNNLLEEEEKEDNITIDVNVSRNSFWIEFPCRRAGVRFEHDEYIIKCNGQNFFIHNGHSDYLQFSGVSYWDHDQDGGVDRVTFNGISLRVSNYQINQFYSEKLAEFRKIYVERRWREYLASHPNPEE